MDKSFTISFRRFKRVKFVNLLIQPGFKCNQAKFDLRLSLFHSLFADIINFPDGGTLPIILYGLLGFTLDEFKTHCKISKTVTFQESNFCTMINLVHLS